MESLIAFDVPVKLCEKETFHNNDHTGNKYRHPAAVPVAQEFTNRMMSRVTSHDCR